jgi:hypothetical protein
VAANMVSTRRLGELFCMSINAREAGVSFYLAE